jgi:alanine racemase
VTQYRPTYAEIDLGAIRSNVGALCERVGPHSEKLALVKANAYGHGDVEVARACLDAGATRLGVALVEEAVRLRDAGIDAPILVVIEAMPEAAKEIVAQAITPSVFTRAAAEALSDAASAAGTTVAVHVCVDTGMHREGAPLEGAAGFVEEVAKLPGLDVEGLWSHFASSDEEGNPFTPTQLDRFAGVCDAVEQRGIDVPVKHMGNSVAAIVQPEARLDMVRMGLAIYGMYPAPWLRRHVDLTPAMRLVSGVGAVRRIGTGEGVSYGHDYVSVRDTTIASVLIGYGDGYHRRLSGEACVLIGGRRRPLAGRVTMDQIMVDCGDDDVAVGDEVVCIGSQGAEEVTADELADIAGTINYEIVCSVGARVPRTYARGSESSRRFTR